MIFNKKVQVIKFEQNLCKASVDDNNILFVRVNGVVNDKKALLEVPYTHKAMLILGGGNAKSYESGTYAIFESKNEIKNWKKGISVEVVYMPKETNVIILWGTPNRFRYRDEVSNKVITIGARGQFGISISNHEQFFRKVVGSKKEFNLEDFQRRFSGEVINEFADCFLKVVTSEKMTYDKFALNKKRIAEEIGKLLSDKFIQEWGISLVNFIIEDIHLQDDEMAAIETAAAEKKKQEELEAAEKRKQEQLKEYLKEIERLNDKEWEKQKYLRELELRDKQAYYEVLKIMGNQKEMSAHHNVCPKCGATYKASDKFCPKCGFRVSKEPIVCPKCKHKNDAGAIFCSECGAKLTEEDKK